MDTSPFESDASSADSLLVCPFCEHPVGPGNSPAQELIRCTGCGGEFVLPEGEDAAEDLARPMNAASQIATDELDGNRIRQITSLRRGAYRHRSYCLIGLVGCWVGAAELFYKAVIRLQGGAGASGAVFYVLVGLGLLILGAYLARLAVMWHREAVRPALADPLTAPDLSKLSDGAQLARNLRNLHE